MGRINNLDIAVHGTKRGFFHPGEEIKGNVVFGVNGQVKVSKITVFVKGIAFCGWVEKQGHIMQNYVKKKDLIKHEIVLLGNPDITDENSASTIKQGGHSFPFRFTLPKDLPTNFKSRIGFVKYCLKVYIERPWRHTLKRKLPFTVVEPIELSKSKELLKESDDLWKEIPLCHTHDNTLSLEASLGKMMYRPGERIVVKSQCDNKTSRNMRVIKAKLIKVKEYYASKTYTESKTVAKIHGPSIPPKRLFTWETHDLIVPRVPASLLSCKIIRLTYVVEVQLVVPMGYNLRVRLPVIIDNVPLKGNHAFPILHGPHLKRRRIIMAMERMLRPKKTKRYNRLSFAADSMDNLELGHEELEDDEDLDNSFQEDLTDDLSLPQKLFNNGSNGYDISSSQDRNESSIKCSVW